MRSGFVLGCTRRAIVCDGAAIRTSAHAALGDTVRGVEALRLAALDNDFSPQAVAWFITWHARGAFRRGSGTHSRGD